MANKAMILRGVSIAALALSSAPALAQTTDDQAQQTDRQSQRADQSAAEQEGTPGTRQTPPASEAIIVTGVRASLASAQSIKRNSTAIVDSIVAEDIGKFPDNTVSDALQRVTGVQVARGAGEAGTVLIRGLPNIATQLNGREAFTGTGRGVALQDIPAELVAGVDVYKTTTPDTVEGGLSGTVNVRLRRPFDFDGLEIAGGGRAVYSDQSDKWGYIGNALVSDRWDTGIGEIGVMLSGSYNRRQYLDNIAFDFLSNRVDPADTDTAGIPDTVGGQYAAGDRRRTGLNASVQWRPTDNLEFHADGLFTRYKNRNNIAYFIGLPKAGAVSVTSTYDDYPFLASSVSTANAYTLTSRQAYQDKTDNYQADFGGDWTLGDTVISSELVYNYSRLPNRNAILDTSFNTPQLDIDFDNGGTPLVNAQGVDPTDPANFTLQTLFDNNSLATSEQWAWRADVQHNLGGPVLDNFKFGVRYTDRQADSQATASQGIPIPNPVPLSDVDGLASLSSHDLVKGAAGIDQFALADTDFLLDNTDTIRDLFGQPSGPRAYDPALAFSDTERTYAFYGQLAYDFYLGSLEIDGIGGARVVNTVQELRGNNVSGRQNYVDVLPSVNLRAHLTSDVQLRLAFAKTLTRPEFAQLNPLVSYTSNGDTGGSGTFYTGGGGNPDLQPIKTTAYDATLGWYPSATTSITASGFYKNLSGYIQTYAAVEPYMGRDALVSRPRNTGSGELYGAELAYQQFFDFLPEGLDGLGLQVNGTYIEGTSESPITGDQQRLVNVSKWSYNVVGIYEKYGLSLRLAYNWRSDFAASYNSGGIQASRVVVDPIGQLDFSANYDVTDNFTLTFDATNLTDRVYHDRFDGLNDASGLYSSTPRDTRTYDRTFQFGFRVRL